jgi:membrane protein DedA with SNARE-associated domain
MSIWATLTETVSRLLDEHSLLAAFVLLTLEESGCPPLIPGDLLMVLVGVRAAEGKVHLLEALAVLELATVIGGSILYWISASGGHAVVERVGRYVGATPERLHRVAQSLEQHGQGAIILGRLIPSLCVLTAVGAGLLGYPYRRFLPALAIGGFLHLLIFVLLGYFFGPPVLRVIETLHPPVELLAVLAILGALIAWLIWAARRTPKTPIVGLPFAERLRGGALAGLLGAGVVRLLSEIPISVGGLFGQQSALERLLAADLAQHGAARVLTIVLTIVFLAVSTLWGMLYGVVEPALRGPEWFRGLTFSAIPLLFSLLVVFPLAGGGWLGLDLGADGLPMLGEAVRSIAYGLTLGVGYAALTPHRSRRPSRPPT